MLVKFIDRGTGGGDGPVDYLLGVNRDREKATVLQGDPELTKELINSSEFSKRYTSGCLSFEENADEISEETKRLIMSNFEKTIFCGMDSDQFNILWVEHADKNLEDENGNVLLDKNNNPIKRLELNFLIPTTELRTGKRFQPYFHAADLMRVDAFQTITNYENRLTDPHDPAKARTMNPFESRNATIEDLTNKDKEIVRNSINDFLIAKMNKKEIRNRNDVIKLLETTGFNINRKGSNYITIVNPIDNEKTRLKGLFFNDDFVANEQTLDEYKQQKHEEYLKNLDSVYLKAKKIWQTGHDLKSAEHQKKFGGSNVPKLQDSQLEHKFNELLKQMPLDEPYLASKSDARQPATIASELDKIEPEPQSEPSQEQSDDLDYGFDF